SQWNNSNSLVMGFFGTGTGTLNVEAGGMVSNTVGLIGAASGSTGVATVTGTGSHWNNSNFLSVGDVDNGTLNVEASGLVSNTDGYIGYYSGSTGVATVSGSGSQWNNSGSLYIGGSSTTAGGTATLNIADSGLVSVGGTTRIWAGSNVDLTGGRFEFGTTTLQEFGIINAVSGSMAGDVIHTGYTDMATFPFQNLGVDLTEVRVSNSGTLYGNGSLGTALRNNTDGEVETIVGERMRFAGVGSTNSGEINNFGGQIRFDQDLTNQSGGLIGGRGQFFANGGWSNDGAIAMSGGFSDVHGDLINTADGLIAIGGGSTTTFYDDVTMDAANLNMEIASDSYGVFLGSYNGGSNGLGTVQAFGDLRPGNSPAVVSFGGDLEMGVNTATYIELGGLLGGEFDQLQIAGDFLLDGSLDVSLIDNFSLGFQQEFLIADIMGSRIGLFDGLAEGDLIGNYGGTDLFISYGAGNGNDISFFTSVPEPGVVGLLGSLMLGLVMRRRRAN
ncbi:PEP-CTERM sorting domain-containing protein, partial [bacterium]|nr:PEP-CTERM sorting domain-containing protein [bacterium]